jgi:hypothetical protein
MRKAKVAPSCSSHAEADLNRDLDIGVCSCTCDRDGFSCFDNDMKVQAPLISNGSPGVRLDSSTK